MGDDRQTCLTLLYRLFNNKYFLLVSEHVKGLTGSFLKYFLKVAGNEKQCGMPA
jgi:hypothetical protein